MAVATIQDFSGMMPLRDGLLLPDRNAHYAKNTWLYKGEIRGFRQAVSVYTLMYADTQQVYRIPESTAEPPDFSASKWVEYPDPYMATIRNPVVGDQWNRYYFFPSDQYSSTGANPDWPATKPAPQYRTYDPTTNTFGPMLILGIPTPATVPTVVAAPDSVTKTATAAVPVGGTQLTLNNTTNLSDGMTVTDTSATTVTTTTTAPTSSAPPVTYATTAPTNTGSPTTVTTTAAVDSPINTNYLFVSSLGSISIGMTVTDTTRPAVIASGTTVTATAPQGAGYSITIDQNLPGPVLTGDSLTFTSGPNNVLHLSNTSGAAVGQPVTDTTNPSAIASGTTITAISGNNITISASVVNNVNTGDNIQCGGGASILTVASTTGILVGMTITDTTTPTNIITGTTVSSISGSNVTMSQDVASSGIASGDTIKFENIVFPIATQIDTSGVVDSTHVKLNAAVGGAGVLVGDTIQFDVTDIENRAYVYTYVSAYGEEGPASQPTNETGNPTGAWTITIPAPAAGTTTNRNLTHIRLYRTVVDSSGNASYYQVPYSSTQLDFPWGPFPITFTDNNTPQQIVSNNPLTSELYTAPPADLQGVVMMANGIAAGWSNQREIWFSAAYLPHAWPASYALTVDFPVVGLTANGASLNIMCKGTPAIATGVTPDTMTIGKITSNEPCIGRGSIVSSGEGAYYASPNGIILLNSSGTLSMTEFVYEKEFHQRLQPWNWAAGHYGMSYVAFIKGPGLTGLDPDGQALNGLVVDKQDKNVPFCFLHLAQTVINMYFDEISGQLFEILSDKTVRQWNPPIGVPGTTTLWDWTWRSKQFRAAFAVNYKCFKIIFDVPPEVTVVPGVRNADQNQVYDPTKQWLIVKIYADNKFVATKEVQISEEVLLIPDGFKAVLWQFVLQGQVLVKHMKIATSVKELKKA